MITCCLPTPYLPLSFLSFLLSLLSYMHPSTVPLPSSVSPLSKCIFPPPPLLPLFFLGSNVTIQYLYNYTISIVYTIYTIHIIPTSSPPSTPTPFPSLLPHQRIVMLVVLPLPHFLSPHRPELQCNHPRPLYPNLV